MAAQLPRTVRRRGDQARSDAKPPTLWRQREGRKLCGLGVLTVQNKASKRRAVDPPGDQDNAIGNGAGVQKIANSRDIVAAAR
ncbi:MAG: hypothetical protein AAF281_00480 [Pseudomonadota bacterium]